MGEEASAMESPSLAMDGQSILDPASSPVSTDAAATEPDSATLADPADDSDLRVLDVTAGEPD